MSVITSFKSFFSQNLPQYMLNPEVDNKALIPATEKNLKKIRSLFRKCENYTKEKTPFGWEKKGTTSEGQIVVNLVDKCLRIEIYEFTTNPEDIEKLKSMLENHDWTYEYSDDSRYYKKGGSEKIEIINFLPKFTNLSFEQRKDIVSNITRTNITEWLFTRLFTKNELENFEYKEI